MVMGFPGGSEDKASACNARDPSSIPGSGRSHEEGNGNPVQYSCLRIPRTEEPGELQSMGSQRVLPFYIIFTIAKNWKQADSLQLMNGKIKCGIYIQLN